MSITQPQFDLVAEWFIRGLPGLETVVPEDPRPTTCTPGISADVRAHVTAMATTGWTARNRDMGLLMHGCAGATNPRDCLASEPRARDTTFGAEWENALAGSTQRVLYTTSYRSSYWTRSSADGRFVGHGSAGTPSSRIIDLQTDRTIGVAATYDPGFFPDNSGWVMLGGTAGVCETSVLTTGMPTMINFTEPGCRRNSMIGLYEHLGASLSGTDYMAVHGVFVSDNGGTRATLTDPAASFTGTTQTRFTLMTNTGSGFVQNATISARTPYEGDAVISPSTRLLITRVAGASERQLGYVLRRVDITGTGTSARVAVPEIARYCFNGAKPAISLDERWIVTHHYIGDADAVSLGFTGPTDPAFAQYRTRGAANVYLIDMLTGATTRITNMQPGQYALFPHFRSDGWIYFIVRTPGTTPEHVVASDAALMLAATPTP